MLKQCFFGKVVGLVLLFGVLGASVMAETMDNSIDVFYIQHNHPRLINGQNIMGTIIVQNNNSNGFHLVISSDNLGKIAAVSGADGESDIDYMVSFEQLSGRVGDGVTLDLSETNLLTDHYLFTGTSQTSSTDIAIKVIVTLYGYDDSTLMAGSYRDFIEVDYTNNN
tara:strand:- start:351 stop:851 length:501 start_codon:yes stop_codon:yes gene_type:complete